MSIAPSPKSSSSGKPPAAANSARGEGEGLPKAYKPADVEPRVTAAWEASGAFHADPGKVLSGERPPYCIFIPPPNVTAPLHLGHALNNTLQDILIRAHRMMGFETLWMPGTDHAGIATQAVVEKRLWNEEKLRKHDLGRDKFVARVQAFKDEYEATITRQLKLMGCSCDFARQRFTMDEQCAAAVREAFFRLFRDGLIYRGKRLVNWDPALQTAVADDETFEEEVDSFFYYLRYPLVKEIEPRRHGDTEKSKTEKGADGAVIPNRFEAVTWAELAQRGYPVPEAHEQDQSEPAYVTVATTRPETYLGDTAVGVSPKDRRAGALRGLWVKLPLVGRVVPIVEDEYVVLPADQWEDQEAAEGDAKARYASGFLKVTPAHDQNDYELYQRHREVIDRNSAGTGLVNVMGPDASISDKFGWSDLGEGAQLVGLAREEARKRVVEVFGERGWLAERRPYRHSLKFSDRSKAVVEPYLSDQWYVRVTDERMARSANEVLDKGSEGFAKSSASSKSDSNRLKFYPGRYAKTYEQWHENIRDWCISRQLWWGHRIPVWHKRLVVPNEPGYHGKSWWFSELDSVLDRPRTNVLVRIIHASSGRELDPHNIALSTEMDAGSPEHAFDVYVCAVNEADVESLVRDEEFIRDTDVLDTWFSSALWPLSTLGWPDPCAFNAESNANGELLRAFNPSSVLCTAREIITLWVSRMVMMNRYFLPEGWEAKRLEGGASGDERPVACAPGSLEDGRGKGPIPFRDVFIHAVIQDGQGQKMSKSLGNGVDPLDIIQTHGADAMRFTLAHMTTQTQDVRLPVDLICPHTGEVFAPKMVTNKDGYVVPAPIQESPKDPKRKMVTGYGVASGEAKATAEMPLAKNTSSKFDFGRNFSNKLWNAARFSLGILEKAGVNHGDARLGGSTPTRRKHGGEDDGKESGPSAGGSAAPVQAAELGLVDRWMLSRLSATVRDVERALANYEFSEYAEALYKLTWWDFCDWYLEAIKPTVDSSPAQKAVLAHALETIVRLLHPVMPFVTEAIWERVREVETAPIEGVTLGPSRAGGLLCTAAWPEFAGALRDEQAEREFEGVRALVNAIRNIRSEHQVLPKRKITLYASPLVMRIVERGGGVVETLAGIAEVKPHAGEVARAVPLRFEGEESLLADLADEVDAGAEKARLAKLIAELEGKQKQMEGRLSNESYIAKAPPKLVEESRAQLAKVVDDLVALRKRLGELG